MEVGCDFVCWFLYKICIFTSDLNLLTECQTGLLLFNRLDPASPTPLVLGYSIESLALGPIDTANFKTENSTSLD